MLEGPRAALGSNRQPGENGFSETPKSASNTKTDILPRAQRRSKTPETGIGALVTRWGQAYPHSLLTENSSEVDLLAIGVILAPFSVPPAAGFSLLSLILIRSWHDAGRQPKAAAGNGAVRAAGRAAAPRPGDI